MKMKQYLLMALLLLTVSFLVHGEAHARLPRDFQEFKARFEKEARTEQGAVKLFFEAIYSYLDPATRSEASKMLRYALYDAQPIERAHTRAVFVERMKNENQQHIFRSYAAGATPANNYSMSPGDFELEFVRREVHPNGDVTLYITCNGSDSPRPISLTKIDGSWHIREFSSIYTQIRPPQTKVDARRRAIDADNDVPGQWDKPPEADDDDSMDNDLDFRGGPGRSRNNWGGADDEKWE